MSAVQRRSQWSVQSSCNRSTDLAGLAAVTDEQCIRDRFQGSFATPLYA